MKVACFNVNSIRARLDILLEWMQKESPDVLCVQETKVIDADFPLRPFEERGYHVLFRGEKSYNGVAIVSRYPGENVRFGFDGNNTYGTRLVAATFRNIPVVNTYIPQGFHPLSKQFDEKLNWFRMLLKYFDGNFSPERPLLWLGDFNVAPAPADVYDPEKLAGHVGYHPDEHAALEKLKEWGFIDIFRKHQHGSGQYTFWDYRLRNAVKRNLGWRVDHIWGTQAIADKSVNAWIDTEPRLKARPSDHTPVIAEFRV